MKKNNFKISFAVLILAVLQMGHLTSCQDDMAADSYYTFTGETMSDFLDNNPNFSLFNQIVERAGRKAFLASRGTRTLFPAVNEGVQAFLDENGYSSVEDITPDYCDILVKTAIVENITIYTAQLDSSVQYNNELDLPLVLRTSADTTDANGIALTIINRKSAIVNELKNDSVENGVVQPVTKLLIPNLSVGTSLLDEFYESEGFKIYYEALKRTGVADDLALYDDLDMDYQNWKDDYEDFRRLWSGHRMYTAKRPDHLYRGFTCMIVKDETLFKKYPDRFSPEKTLDENIEALYELAAEKYGDDQAANIFGLNKIVETAEDESLIGKTYKEAYWHFTEDAIRSPYNPLHMFMAYHVIDRKFESTDELINRYGTDPRYASPTEWVSTLLEFSSMKLERLSDYRVDPEMEQMGAYYINHAAASDRYSTKRVRGSILSVPPVENFVLNVAFYYVDDVLAYDTDMRSVVMNTRIRTDVMTLFPELTNNNIRMSGNFSISEAHDDDETGIDGFNYYIPPLYLNNVSMSGNTTMFIMRPHPTFWNLGGDEINFLGNDYDVEFRLPAVPPGTYEVRMGYAGMADRGIAQIYFDGEPQGIPMDLRFDATDGRVGGIYGVELSDEELKENNRTMKNNGFYRAPASIFRYSTQPESPDVLPNVEYADGIKQMMRKALCTTYFSANEHHKLRVKSVWSGAEKGCFMIDYIELVPIAICGTGGLGEDIY